MSYPSSIIIKTGLLILFFTSINCKSFSQPENSQGFYAILNNELKDFIQNRSVYSTKRKEHLLNNEIKFMIDARKSFFSNINIDEKKEINLVEIFDSEMPSNTYRAVLKLDSKIYLLTKNDSFETNFQEIEFETLKKEHGEMACILIEMDKETPNKINNGKKTASYHFMVFVTKVKGSVTTYMPTDICIL